MDQKTFLERVGVKMVGILSEKRPLLVLLALTSTVEVAYVQDLLRCEHYEVAVAENGIEAIAFFEALSPDIVLVSAQLTPPSGLDICRHIKAHTSGKSCAVFIIAEPFDLEMITAIYAAGADDYITQPLDTDVFLHRIRRIVDSKIMIKILNQNAALSESIIYHAVDGIITLDENWRIKYCNPAGRRIFGYSNDEIIGLGIKRIIPQFDMNGYSSKWFVEDTQEIPIEMNGVNKQDETLPVSVSLSRFIIEEKCYYTLTIRDITARKLFEEKIQYQAFYDALTGLPNRQILKYRTTFEIARAKRNQTKFAIMYLDLDRFKIINDTLGHETGDLLLKEIAARLKLAVRTDDFVARMGGDEFVIILPGLYHVELVGKIASKILEAVKKPLVIEGKKLNVSISIGITIFPDDAEDYELLLTYADIAMYRAKENGKDVFQTFTPELNAKAIERLDLENGLRQAVENEEFVVFYQPKVNTKTLQIVGMEALVRWQHPTLGLISPMSFIPVAEETGLIVPIGAWVLKTACAHNQSLSDHHLPLLTVAVNLSMRQFEANNMVETVLAVLDETGMPPEFLELEITESIAVKNTHYTISVIQELQKLGITFSIDDFGTGYSSLSQINSLSVDKLKIDRSFVTPIDGVKENAIIASTVLTLGKNLNMLVIAEGVETQAQVDFFTDNDCDEMQGYFIAKPMEWERFKLLYTDNFKLFN